SAIDIGDLPAGRPVWVIGRVPSGNGPLSFRLRTGAEVVAECSVGKGAGDVPGLKALFGADRVRRLEDVMTANYAGEELRAELARLGYETAAGEAKVYAENARDAAAVVVRQLLVQESLAAGVPCSATALVAVRSEPGKPVIETRIVANALPHGWSGAFVGGGARLRGISVAALNAPVGSFRSWAAPPPAAPATESVDSMLVEFDAEDDDTTT